VAPWLRLQLAKLAPFFAGANTPKPLNRSGEPFSSPDWVFELKYDGFRARTEIEYGHCRLISRNGNHLPHFRISQ